MSISRRDFNKQCVEFVRRCQEYSDTWTLKRRSAAIKLKEVSVEELNQIIDSDCELLLAKTELRKAADATLVNTHEYTVIYSDSYEVPVMYFCVSNQAGCPISLNSLVSIESNDLTKVINQVEHPVLFRPFYMIHPCRTEDFMKIHHSREKAGYLISWLSIVGTLLGLNLDPRFGHSI